MTELTVAGAQYTVEDRRWVDADPGEHTRRTITLDLTAFNATDHFPNGYLPSGLALAPVGSTGLYGPATDGTAEGFLWSTVTVRPGATRIGAALFEAWGFIRENKLPVALPAAVKTQLAKWFKFRSF